MSKIAPVVNLSATKLRLTLSVTQGPESGAIFQLLPPKVNIGRSPENHIIISDPKSSRQHVSLHILQDKIVLEDLSAQKSALVNGRQGHQLELRNGDTIQIGDTRLVFHAELLPAMPTSAQLQVVKPNSQYPMTAPQNTASQYNSNVNSNSQTFNNSQFGGAPSPNSAYMPPPNANSSKIRFWIIAGVLISAVLYIALDSGPKRKESAPANVEKEIISNTQRNEDELQKLMKTRKFENLEEQTRYREANKHYVEGFRDYNNGQYGRAIRSFETALAIDPKHKLAERYRQYAYKAREDMYLAKTEEAKQYYQKQMYSRCSSSAEKVMIEINNNNDLRFKEALSLKRLCDSLQVQEGGE